MVKVIFGLDIAIWIAFGAFLISIVSLWLSIRSAHFNRKMEAAKIRTNLIGRILLARDTLRALKGKIEEFDELATDFRKTETDEYRKIVKEAINVANIIYDLADKDTVVDPIELERHISDAEFLLTGAKRRIREVTEAIERHKTKPSTTD